VASILRQANRLYTARSGSAPPPLSHTYNSCVLWFSTVQYSTVPVAGTVGSDFSLEFYPNLSNHTFPVLIPLEASQLAPRTFDL